MRVRLLAVTLLAGPALGVGASAPVHAADPNGPDGRLVLPAPVGQIPVLKTPGQLPDSHKPTYVPPPGVRDRERVEVLLATDGTPTAVTVTQRIELLGPGDYVIREPGPAIAADAVGDSVAPVLRSGEVTWQGFSPGRRVLVARITLVPETEASRLPMAVGITWQPAGGGAALLGADGSVPSAGRITVSLLNQTAIPMALPTGDVDAALTAPLLDRLLAAARSTGTAQPPAVARGLPAFLPARGLGARPEQVVAPLRVSGSIRVVGAHGVTVGPTSKALQPTGDGVGLSGTLQGGLPALRLDTPEGGRLVVDLTVVPGLDPRTLQPKGFRSWAAWQAARPGAAARRTAVDQLVTAAAATARDDAVAPYLGHAGPGAVDTAFRFTLAPPPVAAQAVRLLHQKPAAIALAALALAGIAGNTYGIWRQL